MPVLFDNLCCGVGLVVSVLTADELEARYVRLLTGCLSALCSLTELLPEPPEPEPEPAAGTERALTDIITNNKFCKLAKHGHPQVSRADKDYAGWCGG